MYEQLSIIKYNDNKKYHTVETIPQSNVKIVERGKIVEQKLLTLPEHLLHPRFLVGFVLLDL